MINNINENSNCSSTNSELPTYSIKINKDEEILLSSADIISDNLEKEPLSLKQINNLIRDNLNKIQQNQNEIQAKNNLIENKLTQIKDEDVFLNDMQQEKINYIDNLCQDTMNELCKILDIF